jgi:hypothetical protein
VCLRSSSVRKRTAVRTQADQWRGNILSANVFHPFSLRLRDRRQGKRALRQLGTDRVRYTLYHDRDNAGRGLNLLRKAIAKAGWQERVNRACVREFLH